MAKQADVSPWQTLEEEVYHAFREWPIWLALRQRELAVHLKTTKPTPKTDGVKGTALLSTDPPPDHK
jgi:hypothetical protein